MNSVDLPQYIADCKYAIAEYEQRTKLEATELRAWLCELERQLASVKAWRERQNETIDKLAEIAGGQ